MKKIIIFAAVAMTLSVQGLSGEKGHVTVEGELVCLTCYLKDGVKATGSRHVACAEACYSQGLPQAVLERETGVLFLPVTTELSNRGTEDERFVCSLVEHTPVREGLKSYFGKRIAVTGSAYPGNGVTLLSIDKVVEKE
ncbi:MAG: hypothetical protein ACE5GH_00610 [Fidelibacterota bacterium]